MGYYLLYDHFDHLIDEVAFAQSTYGTVYAYVKIVEHRTEQPDHITLSTAVTVTWMRPVERIIHAARMPVDTISFNLDDPHHEQRIERLREQSRFARTLVFEELRAYGIRADHNLLLTAGLREELMQLQTEQLLWTIVISRKGATAERQIVVIE